MRKGSYHTEQTREQMRISAKNRVIRPEIETLRRMKISQSLKGHYPWSKGCLHTEDEKRRISQKLVGQVKSDETKRKMSQKRKGIGRTVEYRARLSQIITAMYQSDSSYRFRVSEGVKRRLTEPGFKEKVVKAMVEGIRKKPTKPEMRLETMLNEHFKGQWRYVGDGKVIIGGFIPDFININGKKQLIEMFGTYWHTKKANEWHQTELGRIMAYNSVGFSCLVIWDEELKDEQVLVGKITHFMSRKIK